MISYIGQFKREKVNSTIREKLKKQKTIYTLMLLGFPLLFLLFDYGYINSPEKISGDRMATCKLINPNGGSCTAFLVSKNGMLITARHCLDDLEDGQLVTLDFDKVTKPGYLNLKAKVIYLPVDPNDDYAIIKLVNQVDIIPLKVAGKIDNPESYNPEVVIIGYPGGESTQTYDNLNAVRNYTLEDSTVFMTNEIYQGMSGGPVINKETGEVIGIVSKKKTELVRTNDGEVDFQDQEGLSIHEKIQQVFNDPNTSHIDW